MKRIGFILYLLFLMSRSGLIAQSRDSTGIQKDSSTVLQNGALPQDSSFQREALVKDSALRAKIARKKLYSIPRRAAIMSTILPGLGQAYNKKYWKIPVIYAGMGAFAYIFFSNNKEYKYYRKNLQAANDEDSTTINRSGYTSDQLLLLKTQYRKSRDLGIIGMGLLYIFNIIDANVDGHLRTFDISDDLSLRIDPWHNFYRSGSGYRNAAGLSLKLTFK